jgi:secretion/DNA translocation related TadE-like protein
VSRRVAERGSASLLVVAMVAVLLVVGAALGVVTAMVRAHRVAQAGADLAALAGAHGLALGRDGCLEASRIAAANDVRLTACRVDGRTLLVTVQAVGPHWLGQTADLSADARAGPA